MAYFKLIISLEPLLDDIEYVLPELSVGPSATCPTVMTTLPEQLLLDGFGSVIRSLDFDLSKLFHDGSYKTVLKFMCILPLFSRYLTIYLSIVIKSFSQSGILILTCGYVDCH